MSDKDRLGDNPLESGILGERASGKQGKHETPARKGGRPRIHTHKIERASQEGLPPGWSRATLILRESVLEELKARAWYERKPIKEYVDGLLAEALGRQRNREEALKGYRASLTTKTRKRR